MQYWTKRLLVAASTSLLALACLFVAGCESRATPPHSGRVGIGEEGCASTIRKEYGGGGFKDTGLKLLLTDRAYISVVLHLLLHCRWRVHSTGYLRQHLLLEVLQAQHSSP